MKYLLILLGIISIIFGGAGHLLIHIDKIYIPFMCIIFGGIGGMLISAGIRLR